TFTAPANMSGYTWSITGNGTIQGAATNSTVSVTANGSGAFDLTLQTVLNGISCSYTKTVTVKECLGVCNYTQGFYGNANGRGCSNNTGSSVNASQLMLNAFGASTSQVFGNVTTRRLFTLYQSDITSGAIFNMLPGGGKPKAIDLDNSSPYSGASYQDKGSWSLVPIQASGPKVGTIK